MDQAVHRAEELVECLEMEILYREDHQLHLDYNLVMQAEVHQEHQEQEAEEVVQVLEALEQLQMAEQVE
jgi:hypothetical protein